MNIKEKIVMLIPKKESAKEIKVPDLKQYLVNGYEEIRQVKKGKYRTRESVRRRKEK